jgi:hypothetical protein
MFIDHDRRMKRFTEQLAQGPASQVEPLSIVKVVRQTEELEQ